MTSLRSYLRILAVTLMLALGAGFVDVGPSHQVVRANPQPVQGENSDALNTKIRPFLKQYCTTCHGAERPRAGLDLENYTAIEQIAHDRDIWNLVSDYLNAHQMPPEGKPQPTPEERRFVVDWIQAELTRVDCGKPNPGRVTLRRLNRVQYNNTIRDLFGIDFKPAEDFPSDDVGYGFDHIGDVLSMPPLLLEKYMAAAEQVVNKAIVLHETTPPSKQVYRPQNFRVSPREAKQGRRIAFASEGNARLRFTFPEEGDYVFRIRATGDMGGGEKPRMELALDGKPIKTFEVDDHDDRAKTYEFRTRIPAGAGVVSLAFINDYYNPEHKDPKQRDRNLFIHNLEIEGPFNPKPKPLPESHRRIMIAQPKSPDQEDAAARRILEAFVPKAWRRPVTTEEIDRLMKLVNLAKEQGEPFAGRIRLALRAVLVSPHFLFLVEQDPDDPNGVRRIDDFEFATRLSYFLWSSMPDEELFALAKQGKLREPEVLKTQIRRMLDDPKSETLVTNFAEQWLNLRLLAEANPDAKTYPAFDEELRQAMRRETELVLSRIIREDRSLLEVLNADYTFVNERLARHYGIEGIKGDEFQLVKLPDSRRGGVVTHASVLTLTSNPTRTSPVKRGKWVLENILGTPPPPPPPNVPELSEEKEAMLQGSLRERLEMHRDSPICASCHQRMDPIGFSLENFDGIGSWRTKDGKFDIDPAGELPDGSKLDGPKGLRDVLKAKADDYRRCFSEKLLTYALGRGLEFYDKCAVDEIAQSLERNGDRFSALVQAIVTSDPFQLRRGKRGD